MGISWNDADHDEGFVYVDKNSKKVISELEVLEEKDPDTIFNIIFTDKQ